MSSRFALPVLGMSFDPASGTLRASPTLDAARVKLGGRDRPDGEVGTIVRVGADEGVVLFRAAGRADVWLGRGRVKRVGEHDLAPTSSAAPDELLRIAARVRSFAALSEGDVVRFESTDGAIEEGRLLEKHRYGGLVLRTDETILAVGFAKLVAPA